MGLLLTQLQGAPLTQKATLSPLCSPLSSRLLSNNKITGLRNGSFLGLPLLEKL